jgi:hypothetical protein
VWVWDTKTGQPLSTIEGYQSYARSVAFSRDGLHLETDQGSTLLPVTAPSRFFLAPQPLAKRISVAERWLRANAEEKLWMPLSYQPSCTAVHSSRVAFGLNSGKVLLIELL